MIASLETVLRGLASPLPIPLGCCSNIALFRPTIFISVLACSYLPLSPTNLYLVHGALLNEQTIDPLLSCLRRQILSLERTQLLNQQNHLRFFDRRVRALDVEDKCLYLIRHGRQALNLLPDYTRTAAANYSGIVILSECQFSPRSLSQTLHAGVDTVLGVLRSSSVTCSFIRVLHRSNAEAHVVALAERGISFGHLPYFDIAKYMAFATFGAFLELSPRCSTGHRFHSHSFSEDACHCPCQPSEPVAMSKLQRALLMWSFGKCTVSLEYQVLII